VQAQIRAADPERRFEEGIHSRTLGRLDREERCETCHAATLPGLTSLGPLGTHPEGAHLLGAHDPALFGCVTCHGGDGEALRSELAHRSEAERPFRARPEAACFGCHPAGVAGAPTLTLGLETLRARGCAACHDWEGAPAGPRAGPLTRLAAATGNHPERMTDWLLLSHRPGLGLRAEPLHDLVTWLRFVSDAVELPTAPHGDEARGAALLAPCFDCHGEGASAVEGLGQRLDRDWLYAFLQAPAATLPGSHHPATPSPADAADLVAALTHAPAERDLQDVDIAAAGRGASLARKQACGACHALPVELPLPPRPAGFPPRTGSAHGWGAEPLPDQLWFPLSVAEAEALDLTLEAIRQPPPEAARLRPGAPPDEGWGSTVRRWLGG
jgi:hypothetical protein